MGPRGEVEVLEIKNRVTLLEVSTTILTAVEIDKRIYEVVALEQNKFLFVHIVGNTAHPSRIKRNRIITKKEEPTWKVTESLTENAVNGGGFPGVATVKDGETTVIGVNCAIL